mmetsp:Transcript_42736/g.85973  ORF Transcript_42736/g.85973 Transcript_42736/m.85973 type:complete len:283 (+) Transcript_42736:2-850(+)
MGEGSSRVVQGNHSVWPSVVEVEGGRDSLLAECFRAMQRYQTRSLRLQMRLDNLTRCSVPAHIPTPQGSSFTGSTEKLQPPPPPDDVKSETSGGGEDSGKAPAARGKPTRGRASSVEGTQIGGTGKDEKKSTRRTSSTPNLEIGGDKDLARRVMELTAELEAQKHRVFEASAQLRSYRVENRLVQRQNQALVAQLLEALGPANAAAAQGEEGATATVTLDAAQCQSIRALLLNLKKMHGEEEDGTLSGEDVVDEGDWRPYVTQAHPGSTHSGSASPVAGSRP